MDRKTKGRLAEVKVISYYIENGYEVYIPFSNNSKYDLLAVNDGDLQRVSVKYTSVQRRSGSWVVELRQISRRNHYVNIEKFNNKQFDLVAVYVGPKNKVVLVDASKVKTRSLYLKKNLVESFEVKSTRRDHIVV